MADKEKQYHLQAMILCLLGTLYLDTQPSTAEKMLTTAKLLSQKYHYKPLELLTHQLAHDECTDLANQLYHTTCLLSMYKFPKKITLTKR
jgi:hypothetical protein